MDFRTDQRGLGFHLLFQFLLALALFAAAWAALNGPFHQLISVGAEQTASASSADQIAKGRGWIVLMWDYAPVWAAAAAVVANQARAAFESAGGVR
jgi:hypothetical protein